MFDSQYLPHQAISLHTKTCIVMESDKHNASVVSLLSLPPKILILESRGVAMNDLTLSPENGFPPRHRICF